MKPKLTIPETYSLRRAASLLGVSRQTLRKWLVEAGYQWTVNVARKYTCPNVTRSIYSITTSLGNRGNMTDRRAKEETCSGWLGNYLAC